MAHLLARTRFSREPIVTILAFESRLAFSGNAGQQDSMPPQAELFFYVVHLLSQHTVGGVVTAKRRRRIACFFRTSGSTSAVSDSRSRNTRVTAVCRSARSAGCLSSHLYVGVSLRFCPGQHRRSSSCQSLAVERASCFTVGAAAATLTVIAVTGVDRVAVDDVLREIIESFGQGVRASHYRAQRRHHTVLKAKNAFDLRQKYHNISFFRQCRFNPRRAANRLRTTEGKCHA